VHVSMGQALDLTGGASMARGPSCVYSYATVGLHFDCKVFICCISSWRNNREG